MLVFLLIICFSGTGGPDKGLGKHPLSMNRNLSLRFLVRNSDHRNAALSELQRATVAGHASSHPSGQVPAATSRTWCRPLPVYKPARGDNGAAARYKRTVFPESP